MPGTTQAQNLEYYDGNLDGLADNYEHISPRRKFFLDEFLALLSDHLDKNARIADIGCGTGHITEMIIKSVSPNTVGVELVPGLIAKARELGRTFEIREADALSLPFRDAELDAVVYHSTVHHLPDLGAVFREAGRVLKPGGYLFLSEPNAYSLSKAVRIILRPKLWLKYFKIFREKDAAEQDRKVLGGREQRSLLPGAVKSGLVKAGFRIARFQTRGYLPGILKEVGLKRAIDGEKANNIICRAEKIFLNPLPWLNKTGSIMIIAAIKR